MTARQTYATSVASAVTTANNTLETAAGAYQEKINSGGNPTVALCSGSGNATYVTAVKNAASAAAATASSAAQTYQASIASAKQALQATGDTDIA